VNTIYTYWGYYNICHLGGEIRNPEKNIPRGIFLSIIGIAVLYLVMQTSILGVLPWRQAQDSPFIVSAFIEKLYGGGAAKFATAMILWIAFASLFSSLLGYSRVPYSAALDGNFFSVFGRLHAKKRFPHVSLLFLGALTFVFALLFKLRTVIAAVLAMRLIIQFIGQAVGVVLLRRRWPAQKLPFKMWLYPLPVIFTILGWIWLFLRTGKAVWWGLIVIILGLTIYLVRSKVRREWPFLPAEAEAEVGR
jgi:amino acid transporter